MGLSCSEHLHDSVVAHVAEGQLSPRSPLRGWESSLHSASRQVVVMLMRDLTEGD